MFEIKILGSSAATPSLKRGLSAVVLNHENSSFLFDCGEATQMQMIKYSVRRDRINHICISHLHSDHYLGLIGLLFSYNLLGREKPLYLYAPAELKDVIDVHVRCAGTDFKYPLIFTPTTDDGLNLIFEDEKVELYSFPLVHKVVTTGFLFKEKEKPLNINPQFVAQENPTFADIKAIKSGGNYVRIDGSVIANAEITLPPKKSYSFAYCSDTIYARSIVEYIKGVTLLYHEATFGDDMEAVAMERTHSTARQAASIAAEAEVCKLVMGHISVRYKDTTQLLEEAKSVFTNTVIANDGDCYKIES